MVDFEFDATEVRVKRGRKVKAFHPVADEIPVPLVVPVGIAATIQEVGMTGG